MFGCVSVHYIELIPIVGHFSLLGIYAICTNLIHDCWTILRNVIHFYLELSAHFVLKQKLVISKRT